MPVTYFCLITLVIVIYRVLSRGKVLLRELLGSVVMPYLNSSLYIRLTSDYHTGR